MLRRYLDWRPNDDEAMFLMAETLIKDETLPASAIDEALDLLSQIPDDSDFALKAHLQTGRIELLIRQRPWAAERALRRVLAINPQYKDAHYLLWKLFDLTARSQFSERHVWPVIEQSVAREKPERLREWYLSQFFPGTATMELDRSFGFFNPATEAKGERELTRFLAFQQREPESPLGYAGEARWMLAQGDPAAALTALDSALSANREGAEASPLFLSAMIETLIDLGRLPEARKWFERWPEPHEGYLYWRWAGIVADEVDDDAEGAVEALRKCLESWPGDADWRTRIRMANCLLRTNHRDQAEAVREEAKRIELLMEDELHKELFARLNALENPRAIAGVIEFYRRLNRPREAAAWEEVVAKLTDRP